LEIVMTPSHHHTALRGHLSGCLLAGIVVAALATACGGSSPQSAAPATPSAPSYVPPPTPTPPPVPKDVLAQIKLPFGSAPTGIVAGFQSLWVEEHRGTDVVRVDPRTDRVIATVKVGHGGCQEPTVGFGHVWVAPCDDSTKVSEIDPATNQVVGGFTATGATGFADGSIWAPSYSGTKLLRVNPRTLKTVAKLPVVGMEAIQAGGYIWDANVNYNNGIYNRTITKIDPKTNKAVAVIHTGGIGDYGYMTYADGSLWLKGDGTPALVRVNTSTDAATTYQVPHVSSLSEFDDVWVAAGLGSIWFRNSDDSVTRVDPKTGRVIQRVPTDGNGNGGYPVIAFGSLWTTNTGDDSLWRLRVAPIK
jgi:streptogramin lyase